MNKVYFGILLSALLASAGFAENKTALAYWSSGAYIDASGNFYGTSFVGPMTITDASVSGKLKVVGTISNATLTASLPVFTDANKVLVSGSTDSVVTNATVGGAALSGISAGVVTNATVGGAELSGVGNGVVTNATVGGAALSGVGNGVVTNFTLTTSNIVFLTEGGSTQTLAVVIGVTAQLGTPAVSSPTISLEKGTPAVSSPTISLERGTATVSSPTISLQKGTFAKP